MLTVASLFSGIGLLDLGLHRAAMHTALLCESDKACRSVLARHYPDTPIHHDVRELTADDLHAAGCDPDWTVLAAGFPCQDLSVAGGRRGMGRGSGTRSALYWHIDRLLAEFAPRWVILENVPGLLSSRGGRDMGAVLGSLADRGYGFAWRVLDAQNFGVPQRRRRVVIVGHLGEPWSTPGEVLFEPAGGGRGSAQVGEAWQVTASAARGRPAGTGGQLTFQVSATLSPFDLGSPSRAVDVVVGTLQARHSRLDADSAGAGHLIAFDPKAGGDRTSSGAIEYGTGITPTLSGSRPHAVAVLGGVTHSLTAEGYDASEDGSGRGCPLVATTLTAGTSAPGVSAPGRRGEDDHNLVAFHLTQDPVNGPAVPVVGAKSGGQGVMDGAQVRRLTPLECERLQGAPDGWTDGQSDSARYRQLGNSVAVPVFEWVGRRLVAVDASMREAAGGGVVTLRAHPDGYTVVCDHCGHSVIIPLSAALRRAPVLAFYEVTIRHGWKGSADNPSIRSAYGHGVFCPECVVGAADEARRAP